MGGVFFNPNYILHYANNHYIYPDIHSFYSEVFHVNFYKTSDVHLYTGLATRLNCQVSQNIPQYEKKLFSIFSIFICINSYFTKNPFISWQRDNFLHRL